MFRSYSIALPLISIDTTLIPHIQNLSGTIFEIRKIIHEDLLALNIMGT